MVSDLVLRDLVLRGPGTAIRVLRSVRVSAAGSPSHQILDSRSTPSLRMAQWQP